MAASLQDFGIDRLSVDERLTLMHQIWDSITAGPGRTYLTDTQRDESKRRLAEHEADPTDVVSWEKVKAEALLRCRPR